MPVEEICPPCAERKVAFFALLALRGLGGPDRTPWLAWSGEHVGIKLTVYGPMLQESGVIPRLRAARVWAAWPTHS